MAVANTPVARHGQLRIEGRYLRDQHDESVQLRGISSHGMQWFPEFANPWSLDHLRDSWNIDVIRLAMYLDEGGFATNADLANIVERRIQFAIDAGLYVIVDWHVHQHEDYERSGDPRKYQDKAVQFFKQIARNFGNYPNLIYEIANEPCGVSWEDIRGYANEVIGAIRSIDTKNLIVVGTPHWSQDVHVVEQAQLADGNLAYAFHFYAGSHSTLRARVAETAQKGIPLFVTEWGTTGHLGTGSVDREESTAWMKLLQAEQISWVNWSLCDKEEASALLRHGVASTGPWPTEKLSESGLLVRAFLLDASSS